MTRVLALFRYHDGMTICDGILPAGVYIKIYRHIVIIVMALFFYQFSDNDQSSGFRVVIAGRKDEQLVPVMRFNSCIVEFQGFYPFDEFVEIGVAGK